ncbi:hypothetical protein D3C86_810570 [compost metagenome]
MLAGPRRLDRRVEGQEVGLFGDIVDDRDDGANLLRGLAQALDHGHDLVHDDMNALHAGDGLLHGPAALGSGGGRLLRALVRYDRVPRHLLHRGRHLLDRGRGLVHRGPQGVGIACDLFDARRHLLDRTRGLLDRCRERMRIARDLGDGGRHLLHGTGGLLDRGRLRLGRLGHLLGARGDLVGSHGHRGRRPAHLADNLTEVLDHLLEARGHVAEFVVGRDGDVLVQVSTGETLGGSCDLLEALGDLPREEEGDADPERQGDDQ